MLDFMIVLFGGLTLAFIMVVILGIALSSPVEIPCSTYADSRWENVPARCVKEFQK